MKRVFAAIPAAFAAAIMLAAMSGALLIAAPAAADEFSDAEKSEIDARVRAYILDNPEILFEAMRILEERQERESEDRARDMVSRLSDEIIDDGYSFVAGNPNGDITVVEFSDYRCGFCKRAHEGVKALIAADDNLRLVIKEFPILGPESTFAARAAMATQRQGDEAYVAFNDAMMRHEGDLNRRAVFGLAAKAGVDVEKLKIDIEDPTIAENIQRTYALARELEINGTPGFIIGDQVIRGYLPYDQLREIVENVREQS